LDIWILKKSKKFIKNKRNYVVKEEEKIHNYDPMKIVNISYYISKDVLEIKKTEKYINKDGMNMYSFL